MPDLIKSDYMNHALTPIGHILTPFSQKFSIPRQGISLSPAKGEIVFSGEIDTTQALQGIEDFSHLWLLFVFHENLARGYSAKVRPPRLGGNKKLGVFATRSSFRPNAIGMSVVKNLGIQNNKLLVGGVDLLTNTPIIDIKPYIPYADSVPDAAAAYAQNKPAALLEVTYSNDAKQALSYFEKQYPDLPELVENLLSQDPRPAYKKNKVDDKIYFIQLWDIEVKWRVIENHIELIDIYSAAKA